MTNAPEPPDGAPATASRPSDVPRARDRAWSLRTVVAAAITAVALSGAGGAALAAAGNGSGSQGSGPGGRMGSGMPGQSRRLAQGQAPGQMNGAPPAAGMPGQLPPATTGSTGRGSS